MSYGFNEPCYGCKKAGKCSDANIIRGAIQAIHFNNQDKGHLGSGNITLECNNKEIEEAPNEVQDKCCNS